MKHRLGFSGTPSDLLPVELGKCNYDEGVDGELLHVLTSPRVVTAATVGESGWSVDTLLRRIALQADPPLHALIDTGALVTGLTNEQVARHLLAVPDGLPGMEGVVFLDDEDRQMILLRAGGRVLPLKNTSVAWRKRFTFYDQVRLLTISFVVVASRAPTAARFMSVSPLSCADKCLNCFCAGQLGAYDGYGHQAGTRCYGTFDIR